ncbi:bromodomain-containing protein DDB_G0280777-like [Helicoverpa zea]|uniref:bromodomain-containing protein DDB_G0280777-like n=1 Tax=Helicoverpa zea TaxID=7113 RepID=UPI001F560F08|nr:bromodomain-containing protein DDB_G0280777-like [Helicoverpa zea]
MKIFIFLALALCAYAAEVKETEKAAEPAKDKRQTQGVYTHIGYRTARKQEQVAPVEEPQDDDKPVSRADNEQYRPGQVFSLNTQELLELQPERKAPLTSNQLLQQLYRPQQEQKSNLQQIYYLEPQSARQVSYQPSSHAVIARPDYTSNGGEASVGAALSVSDSGSNHNDAYNQDLLALLGQPPLRAAEEPQQQLYAQPQQVQHIQQVQQASNVQSVAPQYQQVDRYITKPSKKSKLRNKVQIAPAQPSTAPQQYLIETTNVQQQAIQQSPLYRQPSQPQRVPQALRYVQVPQTQAASQQILYERPESQGLKVVPAPKLQPISQQQQIQQQQIQQQQPRAQLNYRIVPQYQQPEAQAKQYRIYEAPRQVIRPQEQRLISQSVERPVSYLKRFPDQDKMRAVKIYEPIAEGVPQQPAQIIGEQQYYLRPIYRTNEQRPRYEMPAQIKSEQSRVSESAKAPQSSIFVSKNVAPRKQVRPQQLYSQQSSVEQVNLEQHGQSLEEQRAQLPPPKNNKAYTPEEFAALVAAGYAVTPVPVSSINLQEAQSRSSIDAVSMHQKRRPLPANRRHQYLPLRGDDAP